MDWQKFLSNFREDVLFVWQHASAFLADLSSIVREIPWDSLDPRVYLAVRLLALLVIYYVIALILRFVAKEVYFLSPRFRGVKQAARSLIADYKELHAYAVEARQSGEFNIAAPASIARVHEVSHGRHRRAGSHRVRRHTQDGGAHVLDCSMQIVRGAKNDPVQYVIKYFGVEYTQQSLANLERVGSTIARLEGVAANLKERESELLEAAAPPWFIKRWYSRQFLRRLGLADPLTVPYPRYIFRYESPAGRSVRWTEVAIDHARIDEMIERVGCRVAYLRTGRGQRSLMTAQLREAIKRRDGYCCQNCGLSIWDEAHLLLEIDHIIPVSRGGQSVPANLQTLCWQCNRRKGASMPPFQPSAGGPPAPSAVRAGMGHGS